MKYFDPGSGKIVEKRPTNNGGIPLHHKELLCTYCSKKIESYETWIFVGSYKKGGISIQSNSNTPSSFGSDENSIFHAKCFCDSFFF